MQKTITVASKGGKSRLIANERGGWPTPDGSRVCGTGAYKECVELWEKEGWAVRREPNPHYRPRRLFAFG